MESQGPNKKCPPKSPVPSYEHGFLQILSSQMQAQSKQKDYLVIGAHKYKPQKRTAKALG